MLPAYAQVACSFLPVPIRRRLGAWQVACNQIDRLHAGRQCGILWVAKVEPILAGLAGKDCQGRRRPDRERRAWRRARAAGQANASGDATYAPQKPNEERPPAPPCPRARGALRGGPLQARNPLRTPQLDDAHGVISRDAWPRRNAKPLRPGAISCLMADRAGDPPASGRDIILSRRGF